MIRVIVASIAVFALCVGFAPVEAKPTKRIQSIEEQTAVDACRPSTWKAVSRETVAQAMDLLKQYDVASDQLAKLGASAADTVIVSRRAPTTGYKVYEGAWDEVREALQAMLSKRLASLACKLQALGVDMRQAKNSEISRR